MASLSKTSPQSLYLTLHLYMSPSGRLQTDVRELLLGRLPVHGSAAVRVYNQV